MIRLLASILVATALCSAQYTLARRTVPVIAAGGGPAMAVVRQGARTTTGTQDFTSSGFGTPQAAIVVITRATADGTAADHAAIGVGFTDGTNQYVSSIFVEHNVADTDNQRFTKTTETLLLTDDGNVIDCEANFDSWVTDGMRLNYADNACASAYLVTAYLFGGSNVIDAAVGNDIVPCLGGVGTTDTVTIGSFRPHAILTIADGAGASGGTTTSMFSLGAAISDHGGTETITNRAAAWFSNHAVPFAQDSIYFSESDVSINLSLTQISRSGNISATSTTGGGDFTMRCNVANNAFDYGYGYLALDLADSYHLQTVTDPATVTTLNESGAGFLPTGGLMVHGLNTTAGSTDVTKGGLSISGFATNAFANSAVDEDASDPTDAQSLSDNVAIHQPDDDGADQAVATHTFDSLGVDLVYSDIIGSGGHKAWMLLLE